MFGTGEVGDDFIAALSRLADVISRFREDKEVYEPKAGDRVEFVGGEGYCGILRLGWQGTVYIAEGTAYVSWDDMMHDDMMHDCILPQSMCRLLDEAGDKPQMPPHWQWIVACMDFHAATDNLGWLAEKLRRKHVELFPLPEPKDPVCAKCGHRETTVWYCNGRRLAGDLCFKRGDGTEYMHRFCANCGYQWLEPCADAE